ncbi:peptidoglycan-binding protein [Ideonella sp. 4Y16]|uniref:peptidoglycan-binding domain-containing protein n=1 Tax=Ideonella alba TaxID=2824118 RepID=UPI001B37BB86|nr:peptidoglycan-binding domain-containing protein [Ideonella alba]MBQ0944311.1 peptidoglycan-binding protein [Ideonella alba]
MADAYGSRVLRKDMKGPDVVELQIRLAGFRGTIPDGDFGSGTELQVQKFQQDVMGMASPTRVVDRATFEAIDAFAQKYPIDFKTLRCPCGHCSGFGNGRFRDTYVPGGEGQEQFNHYEYPGIHRLLLWAVRAVYHYLPEHRFSFSSGYRCSVDNQQHGRTTTNHRGKAVDLDIALKPGESKRDDADKCNAVRGRIVELSNAQVGWAARNRKSLEPPDIAPTWVHYDVRQYERAYLADDFFCRDLAGLDRLTPITC